MNEFKKPCYDCGDDDVDVTEIIVKEIAALRGEGKE